MGQLRWGRYPWCWFFCCGLGLADFMSVWLFWKRHGGTEALLSNALNCLLQIIKKKKCYLYRGKRTPYCSLSVTKFYSVHRFKNEIAWPHNHSEMKISVCTKQNIEWSLDVLILPLTTEASWKLFRYTDRRVCICNISIQFTVATQCK